MKTLLLSVVFAIATIVAVAQTPEQAAIKAPLPEAKAQAVTLSETQQNAILKAEHKHDQAVDQLKDLQNQYAQLQAKAKEIEQQFAKVTEQEKETGKAVDVAIDAAWETVAAQGITKKTHNFDPATFTFTVKPPEKKPEETAKK